MGSRVEYEVRQLPDSYVTYETQYEFVEDEKARPDRFGFKRQRMVPKRVESRGGWLFIMKGKPGHTLRLTSLDQMEAFGLKSTPRIVDNETGEEVGPDGVPLAVKAQLEAARRFGNLSGPHGTDIDVTDNADGEETMSDVEDPDLGVRDAEAGEAAIASKIDELE
jgi:hypothetical protein